MRADEEAFEREIAEWLTGHGGYAAGERDHFDPEAGLDTAQLWEFIGATQADDWHRLRMLHGGSADDAQRAFKDRLVKEIDARGTVDVLRRGVVDHGVTIRLAYFRPAHGLTPALVNLYNANRLTVTRQLRYEAASGKTVDLALFVNGLPVATAEIKNQITGQDIENAKAQYRNDRDPANVTLARRAVVHFAIDTELVAMTTRLAGASTEFLPFNRGRDHGAGNPVNPEGHRTAYLWQDVWSSDNWLDVLQRFVHVAAAAGSGPDSRRARKLGRKVIFPRYHQWDAVRRLEAAARAEGPGHDYLIEHSAGSGKSNTIAWLAHRLSALHDDADHPVFDKVVVITDRNVLDKQLQDTIYQFDHAHGVVQKIDKDSKQLADALAGAQARIIITTLQKFPVVMRQGVDLPDRKYAVIVDEAHSSQSGESVTDLKAVIGSGDLAAAEATDAHAEPPDAVAQALAERARARGKQPNVSFFAFTATPKGSTLVEFGRRNPVSGKHEPFHLYTMRQAIEEGFILDVLASYVTYETYWNIEKAIPDDPAYDSAKAKAAIARFVSLHEHNLAQKAQIVVEHFRQHVQRKIGGRAKAMVVTASRLHAVRYQQALTAYCREHGYGLGVLVAFSGTVQVGDGPDVQAWTEANMNGFPESRTPERFAESDSRILVVADKYQTGFDQPLLYAMYVDKALGGVAAVQTLSRLNRTCDGKDGTFVLDFRNDSDQVREAFARYYMQTVAPPTDPNLMYDTRAALDPFGVLWPDEIERALELLTAPESAGLHGRIHAALVPSIDRFRDLQQAQQDAFRDALSRFINTYGFLSQVVAFTDTKLEGDYLFCRALAAFIRSAGDAGLDLGSAVELTRLRTEQTFAGSLALKPDTDGEVSTLFAGAGRTREADEAPLSEIVASLNERFGTDFGEGDFVGFFGAVSDKLVAQADIQQAAANNTPENFRLVLQKEFEQQVISHMGAAEAIAFSYLDNESVRHEVLDFFLPIIMGQAQVRRQEYCPIGELLGPDKENAHLEYKASLRTHAGTQEVYKPLETAVLKTIAAFANSRDGGTLLIGVNDDGTPCGLVGDYASLHKPGKDDRDLFQQHLSNIVYASMGAAVGGLISVQMHSVDGLDICRVQVPPSATPVDATVTVEVQGKMIKKTVFYIRIGNTTREAGEDEKAKHILNHWPRRPH
jgi:type I restriction enzyme, R subunit